MKNNVGDYQEENTLLLSMIIFSSWGLKQNRFFVSYSSRDYSKNENIFPCLSLC
jgi:hypothetical protein